VCQGQSVDGDLLGGSLLLRLGPRAVVGFLGVAGPGLQVTFTQLCLPWGVLKLFLGESCLLRFVCSFCLLCRRSRFCDGPFGDSAAGGGGPWLRGVHAYGACVVVQCVGSALQYSWAMGGAPPSQQDVCPGWAMYIPAGQQLGCSCAGIVVVVCATDRQLCCPCVARGMGVGLVGRQLSCPCTRDQHYHWGEERQADSCAARVPFFGEENDGGEEGRGMAEPG